MKLRIVTKMSANSDAKCRQILTPLSFFRFAANLEQSGSRVPEAQSEKIKIFVNSNRLSYKN